MDADSIWELLATGDIFAQIIRAGKPMPAGEGLFMSTFTNQGSGKKALAFAARLITGSNIFTGGRK